MDFALTTAFVVPSATLASAGGTQDLTAGQFGVFGPSNNIVTSGNIAAQRYIYFAQGRKFFLPSLGSKKSDKITAQRVKKWYKVVAEDTAALEVWEATNFNIACGKRIVVTLNAKSNQIAITNANGFTKSVWADSPCCDCGEVPCTTVSPAEIQAMVDELAAKINATGEDMTDGSSMLRLSTFFSASRQGTGATSRLVVSSKPQPVYTAPYSFNAYTPEYDRVAFTMSVYADPDSSADYYVEDICNVVATKTLTQRSTYRRGTSAEALQMEKNYHSYQTYFKHLYDNGDYNGAFESFVVDGTFYDFYYIEFYPADEDLAYNTGVRMDAAVIVAYPTGTGTAFETLMTALLGAPVNQSGTDVSTTTTSSTTSTTTSTTTTFFP